MTSNLLTDAPGQSRAGSQSAPLPTLPLPAHGLQVETSVRTMHELLQGFCPAVEEFKALGPESEFRHKSGLLEVGDSRLVVGSHTPVLSRQGPSERLTMLLPLAGRADAVVGRRPMSAVANHSALFFTGVPFDITTTVYSGFLMKLDPVALNTRAQAMLGREEIKLSLQEDRALHMRSSGGLRLDQMFVPLLQQIALSQPHPALMAMLGLEDQLHRLIAMMLLSPAGDSAEEKPRQPQRSRQVLDRLCEYIEAHLPEPITLTDLELRSGLSRRMLQYQFKQHLGCSPMQWVRTRRLELARGRLLAGGPGITVLSVALDLGFSSPGDFANAFRKHFGVRPSEVLQRPRQPDRSS